MSDTNDVRRAHDLLDELYARAELSQEQEKLLRSFLPEMPKQKTLKEMNAQMEGIKSEAAPELPAGMHIAEHEHYGPVVVSPGVGPDGRYEIFYLDPVLGSGTDLNEVEPGHLTFSDVKPAKPAYPEFLETEADYQNAPEGTIVALDGVNPWVKEKDVWVQGIAVDETVYTVPCLKGARRVLRWGWGK